MQTVFGFKQRQSQVFLEDGTRVPVTVVSVSDNTVTQIKTLEKEGYNAIQVGIGASKKTPKPLMGHVKKANVSKAPQFVREMRVENTEDVTLGSVININEEFKPGDTVDITGVSKGKGFAGGVKRYGFRGGPKTHGQSDRHRAPGSIGQGTTPGRVYKGKRMAGHMGAAQTTIENLYIVDIQGSDILVAGLIPGSKNTLVRIEKTGEKKNFVPVFKVVDESEAPEAEKEETVEAETHVSEQKGEEQKTVSEESKSETTEEKTAEPAKTEDTAPKTSNTEEKSDETSTEVKEEENGTK